MTEETKYDQSKPLPDERHENYAQLRARGLPRSRAYLDAGFQASNRNTRDVNAARLEKRPEVTARIAYLKARRAHAASGGESESYEVTRDVLRRKLARALHEAGLPAEISQITQALLKVQPELVVDPAESRPDPALIVSYVASFAGMTPDQVARELGGVRFIADKLCHVTKIPAHEFRDAFAAKAEDDARGDGRKDGGDGAPEGGAGASVPSDGPPPSIPGAGYAIVPEPGPETPEPPSA